HHMCRRSHYVDAPHVADPAYSTNPSRAGSQLAQLVAEPRAVFRDGGKQRRVAEALEHVFRDSRNEGAPAERRTVIAGLYRCSNLGIEQDGSHWQSGRNGLRERQKIWLDAETLVRKQLPCATQ